MFPLLVNVSQTFANPLKRKDNRGDNRDNNRDDDRD